MGVGDEEDHRLGRRLTVGIGRPHVQGHCPHLHEEPPQEEPERDPVHRRSRDEAGEVGEVERPVLPVQEGNRKEDEQPPHRVHDHRLERRLRPAGGPGAVADEPTGGDRGHLEEHEQVEQVPGERHPDHPRPEERAQGEGKGLPLFFLEVPPRVGERHHRQEGRDRAHERAEGVHGEHDPDREPARGERLPGGGGAQGVDLDPSREDLHRHEPHEGRREGRDEGEPQVPQGRMDLPPQREREPAEEGHGDGEDRGVRGEVHPESSVILRPSSVFLWRWMTTANESMSAVVASPITMLVRVRACGVGRTIVASGGA